LHGLHVADRSPTRDGRYDLGVVRRGASRPGTADRGVVPARLERRPEVHLPVNRSNVVSQGGSCGTRPYRPPATSTNDAVEYDASSDSSHKMARATSIASPPRRIG